jgi:hypothetical protein
MTLKGQFGGSPQLLTLSFRVRQSRRLIRGILIGAERKPPFFIEQHLCSYTNRAGQGQSEGGAYQPHAAAFCG